MPRFVVALFVLVLACETELVSANSFLQAQPETDSQFVVREDIEQLLRSGLSGFTDHVHLDRAKDDLRDMFNALPKDEYGKLEPTTVRYALHRYFVQKHGWYVRGLDRFDRSNQSSWSSAATIMKDRAPALMLEKLSEGVGFHELAVVAITLLDLIHAEAVGLLESVFVGLELPATGPMTAAQVELAIKAYLIEYLNVEAGTTDWKNASQVEEAGQELMGLYPGYNDTVMWVQDFRQTYAAERTHRWNPFVPQVDTFSGTVAFVQEFGHHFGAFQDVECRSLKNHLLRKDPAATGRVPLSDFYYFEDQSGRLFTESVAYLRNLGALDESDPYTPKVMIANYLISPANCLSSSSFYSVCCTNECDGLIGQLEREIASASAAPARIADVVSRLRSATVDAPRNISASLLARLDDIADFNEGSVPLHGRLFAQWMHHAYPRECPYPQVAGAEKPMSLDEWEAIGRWPEASLAEMESYRPRKGEKATEAKAAAVPAELPWAAEEELVSEPERWTSASLQGVMAVVALASFAAPLLRAAAAAAADVLAAPKDSIPQEVVPGGAAPKAKGKAGKPRRKLQEAVL